MRSRVLSLKVASVLAGSLTAVLPGTQGSAVAQTRPAADRVDTAAQLGEIVVTATKREERVRDVAMGATALGGPDLNDKQALTFEDIAALAPGLSLQSQGNGFTRLVIRGLNAGTSGSTVGVYIDESPIGSSNGLVRGGLLTANADTWDLQRVEVLRGPQGTLYGASTEGGLIKFVSALPDTSALSGTAEIGAQTVEKGESATSIKGVLNVPIFIGRAAVRLSPFYEQLPGYIDDPTQRVRDINGGDRKGFRGSFLVNPSDAVSIRLTAFRQNTSSGARPAVDAVGSALTYANPPANRLAPVAGDLVQNRYAAEAYQNRIENYSGIVTWDVAGVRLTSVTSEGRIRQRGQIDYTSAAVAPGFTYGDILTNFFFNGVKTGLAAPESLTVNKFSQEFRLASTGDGALSWQVGAFYTRERGDVSLTYFGFPIPSSNPRSGTNFGTQSGPSTYKEWAGFGELTYKFGPAFDVAVGARYAHNSQDTRTIGTASPLLGPALDVPSSSSGNKTTYSLAPRWHVTDDTLVYARYATGYRPGGPNFVPPGAPPVPLTYDEDTTSNYELGIRTGLFGQRLYVDLAAFYINWKDIQVFQIANAQGYTANAGGARSRGIEGTISANPVPRWNLVLTGAYTAAVITKDAPDAGAFKDQRLPFVPRTSGSLDTEYRWPAGGIEAFVGGTFAYVGEQYTDFGASPIFEPHSKLPSYTTLALRAGLSWKNYRVQLYGKNVTDKRGITAYSNTGTPNLAGLIGIIQPATYGLLLSASFD